MEKCAAGTLYKLAKTLGVTVDEILDDEIKRKETENHRSSFEIYKSNICHHVKDMGDIDFVIDILEHDEI